MKLSKETDQGNYGKGGSNPKRSERRGYMLMETLMETGQTMEEYLEDLIQQGPYKRHFSEDVVMTIVTTGERITGPDAVGQAIGSMHRPVSGARLKIKNVVLAEGQAVVELAFTDGHTDEFTGTWASRKAAYCVVYDLEDQKISGLRLYSPMDTTWPELVKTNFPGTRKEGILCETAM